LEVDVNAQYAGLEYHAVYLSMCAYLVWMIIPGLGLLYGGLARRKSSLAMLYQAFGVIGVITFQWMFWGYTLAYSRTAGPFIGDMANFGLIDVTAAPSPGSSYQPEILFVSGISPANFPVALTVVCSASISFSSASARS
jgi:Amt family ammonium transporter